MEMIETYPRPLDNTVYTFEEICSIIYFEDVHAHHLATDRECDFQSWLADYDNW